MERVIWWRAKARCERWEEEEELLVEEMRRTLAYLQFYKGVWESVAGDRGGDGAAVPGKGAYAHKQAGMFAALLGRASEMFGGVVGTDGEGGRMEAGTGGMDKGAESEDGEEE